MSTKTFSLEDRLAIVTGANTGPGKAIPVDVGWLAR
jgi:hypothetical protein